MNPEPESDDLDSRIQGRGVDARLLEQQRPEDPLPDELMRRHQRTMKTYAVRGWQEKRQNNGLCIQCGAALLSEHHVRCDPCRGQQAERARQRRQVMRIAGL